LTAQRYLSGREFLRLPKQAPIAAATLGASLDIGAGGNRETVMG